MNNIVAIIPARMGSSRFPGKPLAKIHGMPMIGHVYLRTKMSSVLNETYVATCDKEIFDYLQSIDGRVVMTAETHERCSDRTAEAMLKIEAETGRSIDIVVMVQGDEPMVMSEMIEQAVAPMISNGGVDVVNLMARIKTVEEFEDPNEVKVVVGLDNHALYFSREPIPSRRKGVTNVPMLKQVCIIPFRRNYLMHFNDLPQTPLEKIESVDMMRCIEHGNSVYMVLSERETMSVDTLDDLKKVERMMEKDSIMKKYLM